MSPGERHDLSPAFGNMLIGVSLDFMQGREERLPRHTEPKCLIAGREIHFQSSISPTGNDFIDLVTSAHSVFPSPGKPLDSHPAREVAARYAVLQYVKQPFRVNAGVTVQ